MNQWAFVLAAYGLVLGTTAMLIVLAWRSMRRAEAEAETLKRRP